MARIINLDGDGSDRAPLSEDARAVLRAVRWYDDSPSHQAPGRNPTSGWVEELSLRQVASKANLSPERTRAAVEELISRDTSGIGIEGDQIVLRG